MKFLSRLRFRRRRNLNPNPIPIPSPNVEEKVTDTDHSQLTNRHHMEEEEEAAVVVEADEESSSSSSSQDNYDEIDQHLLNQTAIIEESSSSSSQHNLDEIDQPPLVNRTETTSTSETTGVVNVRETNGVVDGPPIDDCCPICFGGFVAPCRAPCGHWYCGGCILEYWNHVAAFRPCKCPMCSRQITKLMPEPSLFQQEDVEVSAVLKNVQQYNRLFVGGIFGFLLKILQFPLFMKKVLQAMMDPDRPAAYLGRLRLFAVFLGALYTLSPFDFLPTGRRVDAIDLFDYSAICLSFILYLVGLYRQRRRLQNVRQLAGGIQP